MMRISAFLILLAAPLALAGCGSRYSADEYAVRAVQQANPVQQGVVTGFRRVAIAAEGSAGTAAGGAAGGVIGSAAGGGRLTSALGTVGGALVGGLVGTAAERATANTDGIEYIIRRLDNDALLSVTQRDAVPIAVGTRVLVITGSQARVLPDYTAPPEAARAPRPPPVSGPVREVLPDPALATPAAPVAPPPVVPAPPPPV
ncbi:MAG TPA: hypothetical protein VEY31_12510 [Roseococcus sp.]|jgi:outer membrane lipoprotein SlyB|nr:hypothetical protein [Roseococcus sp.]